MKQLSILLAVAALLAGCAGMGGDQMSGASGDSGRAEQATTYPQDDLYFGD